MLTEPEIQAKPVRSDVAEITITLPDGSTRTYANGTTGMQIAHSISPRLADAALGIFVNDIPYDLATPIEFDASVRIVQWRDDEGKGIFWHSSAHLMAEAIEAIYPGTRFGIGPPIENGWYYDMELPEGVKLSIDDLKAIEEKMYELSKRDVPYRRIPKEYNEAIEYFKAKGDWLKLELLEGLAGQPITFYEQGAFVDLCRGTHVPSTGKIKFPKLLSVAGAYWRGDEKRPMLTRVYGVSFPTKKELDEFVTAREEAEKRDHKKLGRELELFLLTPKIGGGLPVWLPNGAVLRYTLETFLRRAQQKRGYDQVVTPHIGNIELYKTSGHYPYYKDSQFPPITLENEDGQASSEAYLLKPMNCPHHFTIFNSKPHSYRDLPVRLAEFGTVYRYEQSGELSGLSRVRSFTQDDAHLFMMPEQLRDELCKVIELTQYVSKTLGFDQIRIQLSFRDKNNPEKYGGNDEQWERAEHDLVEAAKIMNLDYKVVTGEAAFYGPKIDFMMKDSIGRQWQLGTVQVDYVMPERFNMEYIGADGQKHRPVVIHRAPFGSFERFCSLLIEHYAGNFPTWLAPVQVVVLPITDSQDAYAREVLAELESRGIRAKLDASSEKVNARIRDHELMKVPIMLVLGQKELDARSVAVRRHGKGNIGTVSLEEALGTLQWNAQFRTDLCIFYPQLTRLYLNEIDTTTASPDATPAGGDSSKPASPVTVGGMTLKKRAPRPAGAAAPSSAPAPTLVKRPGGAPRPAGPAGAAGGPPKGVSKRMERFSRVLPSRDPGVRMNENIRVAEIRVIDAEGQMIGVMSPREAIEIARAKEMDLIEIVPNAKPPVCKIVEFGKWKYEQQKKEKQAKKSSHQQLLKEVRFHPRTDTHDFEFKVRHARTFIEEGNKVKAYVQFKGREVSYKQFGEVLLNDFKKRMEDIAKVDQDISMMGRMMSMVLSPSGKKKAEPKEGKEPREPREPKEAKEGAEPKVAKAADMPSTDGVEQTPAAAEPEE